MHLARFLIFGCLLGLALPLHAQEATAGSNLGAQASWTALQNMLTATNGNVSILRTDVNAMKACGTQGKVWNGATCINGSTSIDTSLYDKVVACGDQGRIYDKSSNSCINASTNALNCSLAVQTYEYCNGRGVQVCPAGWTTVNRESKSCGNHGDDLGKVTTCHRVTCS